MYKCTEKAKNNIPNPPKTGNSLKERTRKCPNAPQQHDNRTTHTRKSSRANRSSAQKKKHRQRQQEFTPQREQTAPGTKTSAQQQKNSTECTQQHRQKHTPHAKPPKRQQPPFVSKYYLHKINIEQIKEQTHRTKATYKCLHYTRIPRPTNNKTHNRPQSNTLLEPPENTAYKNGTEAE